MLAFLAACFSIWCRSGHRVDADARGLSRTPHGSQRHLDLLPRAAGPVSGRVDAMRWRWRAAVAVLSGAILACFALSMAGGVGGRLSAARRPLHGVIYPALNSRISCVRNTSTAPRRRGSRFRASRRIAPARDGCGERRHRTDRVVLACDGARGTVLSACSELGRESNTQHPLDWMWLTHCETSL